MVFGWYVTGGQERAADGHINQVSYDAAVFAKSGDLGVDDDVLIPGVGWCAIDGPPSNYDNGPWFTPGLEQVTLRRVSQSGDY